MNTDAWRSAGETVPTVDGSVFSISLQPTTPNNATPVLCLHGFPTSSWDFAEAAKIVARDRRVHLFDFLGFGFSAKPEDYAYSLFEQADVACAVARARGITRAHIWAHDMGTSVGAELLARRERGLLPFEIESLILMNGSVHIEMAAPTLGQHILLSPAGALFARLARQSTFAAQMRRIFGVAPSEETLASMWTLLSRDDGARRLPAIIRYMRERARFRKRWIGALARLDVPALVGWGALDPVAVLAIAERLASEIPKAEKVVWPDLGHYPQVEAPARVAETVTDFLRRIGG